MPEYVSIDWKANGHRDRHDRESGKVKAEGKTEAERAADKRPARWSSRTTWLGRQPRRFVHLDKVVPDVQQHAGDAVVLMAKVTARLSARIILAVRADDTKVWQYDHHGELDFLAPVHERTQAVGVAVTRAVA